MARHRSWGVVAGIGVLLALVGPTVTAGAASSGVQQAASVVKAAQAPLNTWTAPGPRVNAGPVAGKTVAYIPDAPSIPYTQATYAGFQQAAKIVGVKPLFLTNDSTPSGWEQDISEAISDNVSAIVLQGIPSGLISIGIKQANTAKIPVIETSDADVSAKLQPGVAAQVQYPVKQVGKVMAAYAISKSKGKVNATVITSSDTSAAAPLLTGIRGEFKAACKGCTLNVVDVPVADWATKLPQLVPNLLQANKSLNWILPLYDSEMPYVVPAVTNANAQTRVQAASFNATPGIMKYLAQGNVLTGDVGNPEAWFGFEFMDQAIRLMTGNKPLSTVKEYDPIRLFTTANFTSATLKQPQTSWYGKANFVAGYTKLWMK